jgi:hypothetical protein
MSPSPALPSPLHGVTLEQYAGITAALAEGLPLADVLREEQIPADAWPQADAAWKVQIAKDGPSGPLFTDFCAKKALAEDTLARAVAPIDADLAAWMSFLRAYGAHAAPDQLLAAAGLGLNDLSRLRRRWDQRLKEDAKLKEQAAEIAKKGPGPLPPLRVEPPRWKRFPWSKGPAPEPPKEKPKVAVPVETSLAPGKVRLYGYVAIKAELLENPGQEAAVLARLAVQDFAVTDAGWKEILAANPDLERDYRRLLDKQRARLRGSKRAPAAAPAPTPAPVAMAAPPPPPPPPEAPPPASLPPVVRPAPKLAGTALAVDVPIKAALPFQEGASPLAAPPPAEPASAAPRKKLAGTALAVDVPRGPALPFDARDTPPASAALTLEQHASLACEIAEDPEHAPAALARYRLTVEAKRALDQHFQERFAREPAAREAWEHAYQTYRAFWLANRVNR